MCIFLQLTSKSSVQFNCLPTCISFLMVPSWGLAVYCQSRNEYWWRRLLRAHILRRGGHGMPRWFIHRRWDTILTIQHHTQTGKLGKAQQHSSTSTTDEKPQAKQYPQELSGG